MFYLGQIKRYNMKIQKVARRTADIIKQLNSSNELLIWIARRQFPTKILKSTNSENAEMYPHSKSINISPNQTLTSDNNLENETA